MASGECDEMKTKETQSRGCLERPVRRPFAIGERVRCHADCLSDPPMENHWDGILLREDNRRQGWWRMTPRPGFSWPDILVHEQELTLTPNDRMSDRPE